MNLCDRVSMKDGFGFNVFEKSEQLKNIDLLTFKRKKLVNIGNESEEIIIENISQVFSEFTIQKGIICCLIIAKLSHLSNTLFKLQQAFLTTRFGD